MAIMDTQDRLDAERIERQATVVEVKPPIPSREWDYCAYLDPEDGPYGWGWSREAAIANLIREAV